MENRELKLEHLDPLKWLRPPFVRDQCQERRWNIQEKEMSLTVSSTEIQSFSLALMTNCWFSTAAWSFQNFNCFGHSPRGCLEAILYELLYTILKKNFRFIYLEVLFKYLTRLKNGSWTSFSHFLLQTFQRWSLCRVQVHWGFGPSLRLKHMNVHPQMFGPWQGPDIQNIFLWGPLYPLKPGLHFETLKSRQVFSSKLENTCTVKKVKVNTS